jgi:hypothetical protein
VLAVALTALVVPLLPAPTIAPFSARVSSSSRSSC